MAGTGAALRWWAGWPGLWAYLAAVNGATLLAYARDKRAARLSHRRTPELALHALALAGGSPAALIARPIFHHKTLKRPFRAVFWAIIVFQALGVGAWALWWATRAGH